MNAKEAARRTGAAQRKRASNEARAARAAKRQLEARKAKALSTEVPFAIAELDKKVAESSRQGGPVG